jgi:hypothetical protein
MSAPDAPLLAIDPGRDKCGLAVVDARGGLLCHEVAATAELESRLEALLRGFSPSRVLMGDGTKSRDLRPKVIEVVERVQPGVQVDTVGERHTTERGRLAYWRQNPPKGLLRWVPEGMRVPPEPYDDYAAWCLALSWMGLEMPG